MARTARHRLACSAIALALVGVVGCSSTIRVTDTARTGTQQLLLNSAFDIVVEAIDFAPLTGSLVYLDASNLEAEQKGYLVYRLHEALVGHGVRLSPTREDADLVLEAGLSAYGTDSETFTVGITGSDRLPKAMLRQRDDQFGVAQLSLFAYHRESGVPIWRAGPLRADSWHRQQYWLGTGPYRAGSVRHPATGASGGPIHKAKRFLGGL